MAEEPWGEGRQAWRRLSDWIQQAPGDGALQALGDVGSVRRLLDRAEFEAVRGARRQGRSWSEIAVRLGVTRQSAWERWRDLDEDPPADPVGDAAVELTERARQRRRSSSRVVPDVIGMSLADARQLLSANALVGVAVNPQGLATDGVVVDQTPESGAKVPPGSEVKLWLARGDGGSGVREPRRPVPDPLPGTKHLDEPV